MAELILEINGNKIPVKGIKLPFYVIYREEASDDKRYKFTRSEFGCLIVNRDDKKKKFDKDIKSVILADKI